MILWHDFHQGFLQHPKGVVMYRHGRPDWCGNRKEICHNFLLNEQRIVEKSQRVFLFQRISPFTNKE